MKIYLASRFSRREEMLDYAAQLRDCGIEVTSRWINGGHQISDDQLNDGEAELALGARYAREDEDDLMVANICVFFSEEPRSISSRGGRHAELGLALAWGKRIMLVGPRENVFMCLPQIKQFDTWHDCYLDIISALPARQLIMHRTEDRLAEFIVNESELA